MKKVTVGAGQEVYCDRCRYLLAILAPGMHGWLDVYCPKCGMENRRCNERIPWSQIW